MQVQVLLSHKTFPNWSCLMTNTQTLPVSYITIRLVVFFYDMVILLIIKGTIRILELYTLFLNFYML